MAKKVYDNDITISTDWGGDSSTGGLPVSGRAIQKFIKTRFEGPFVIYEDVENECFRFFTTDENAQAWFDEYNLSVLEGRAMDQTIAALEFPGNFIPGTPNFTASVTPLHGDGEKAIEGSTGNYIQFRPNIIDRSKNDTNESIDVYVTVTNDVMSRTMYSIHKSNELVTIDIDEYLYLGSNDIVIMIKGRASGASKTIVMTYTVFRLLLESSFNISSVIEPNRNFSVSYKIIGNGQKVLYFFIDGVEAYNTTIGAGDTEYSGSQTIVNTNGRFAPGKHTLQLYAMSNGYPSDLLYYEFVIGGIEETFTTCLVSYTFPSGQMPFAGNVPGFKGTQYISQKLVWAYYTNDPTVRQPKITWRLYKNNVETHLATREADVVEAETDKMPDPVEFMPDDYGNYRLQAVIEGYDWIMPGAHSMEQGDDHTDPTGLIACYSITVAKNDQVQEQTDGLILKYSGLGRSNDEPESTLYDLADRGIAATFHGMPFNGRYGYIGNAIVVGGGAYITVPVNPLDSGHDVRGTGSTVEVDFETTEVKSETTPVFQIGALTDYHIAIYATRAELMTNLGTNVTVRFRENERHKIALMTYPDDETLAGTNIRFLMLYIDGIRTACVQYGGTDIMYNDATQIVIGDPTGKATIKLYYLRIYEGLVSHYRILDHYIIDSGSSISELVKRNDIFVEGSHSDISVDKLKAILPVWELTGPFDTLFKGTQDKTPFVGSAKYTDTANPDLYMEGDAVEFKPSGESSLSDNMVKGIHVKFNKGSNIIRDSDGKAWNGNRWTPFPGNVPERKIRLNADGLESSHTHNAVLQTLINTVYPKVQIAGEGYVLRTPIQSYVLEKYPSDMAKAWGGTSADYTFPYKINYAADWKPVACVWRKDENTPYSLLGIFSMGEEKKSDYAHGRRSVYLKKPADNGTLDPFDMMSGVKGDRGYNNGGTVQFEMVRDSSITFMTSYSTWTADHETDMEKVYQDEDDLDTSGNDAEWNYFRNEVLKPMADLYGTTELDANGIPWARGDQDGFHRFLFGGTFNIWSFLAARIIIRRCGLTDTYVRNSQWLRLPATAGPDDPESHKWWFAFWDLDMAFGLQQPSGALVIDPCLDRTDKVDGNFVFTGKQNTTGTASWWWDAFDREVDLGKARLDKAVTAQDLVTARSENLYYMLIQMEDALANAGFLASTLVKNITEMAQEYGEALYNADGQSKYLDAFGRGSNYLLRLQGSRLSHMAWWIYESFERWDAEYVTGRYQANAVSLRLVNNQSTSVMKLKAAAHSFFGFGATTTVLKSGVELWAGDTVTWTLGRTLNANDPLQIYVPNKIEALDCSDFAEVISGNVELTSLYNSESTTMTIRELNIGVPVEKMRAGVFNNASNKTWTFPSVGLNTLESFCINGYRYVSNTGSLDMSQMKALTTFHAIGATGLTSVTPANGSTIGDYKLPVTLKSLVMVSNTIESIEFWEDFENPDGTWTVREYPGVPAALTTLQMTQGMGNDTQAHRLFKGWLEMILEQPDHRIYRVTYTNVNITEVPIESLLLLARMKKDIPSSVNISGVLKCSTEYTVEDMNLLMDAFGDGIFTKSNSIVFDCNSENLIISAAGSETSVSVEDGVSYVEVIQGSNAQFQAVGFPITTEGRQEFEWTIYQDDDELTGIGGIITFGSGYNTFGRTTGALVTNECPVPTKTYRLYCENLTTGADGEIMLRIIPKVYPDTAVTEYKTASISYQPSYSEGVMQILDIANYLFEASHSRTDGEAVTGHMTETFGGVWTLTGYNADGDVVDISPYVTSNTSSYLAGHSGDDEYCLQILSLPREEISLSLAYRSNWRNGITLEADPLMLALVSVIYRVLGSSSANGNPPLFYALADYGIRHSEANYYNSMELKKLTGTTSFETIFASMLPDHPYTIADLTTFVNGEYNILRFLRNLTVLDITGASGLEVLDMSPMAWLRGFVYREYTGEHFRKSGGDPIVLTGNKRLTSVDTTGSEIDLFDIPDTVTRLKVGAPEYLEIPAPGTLEVLTVNNSCRITELVI